MYAYSDTERRRSKSSWPSHLDQSVRPVHSAARLISITMLLVVAYSLFVEKLSKLRSFVRLEATTGMLPASAGVAMKQYLLSVCYPVGGSQPPPDVLNKIKSDVVALREEMQSAGVWVFSGGLCAPSSATVLRHHNGDIVLTDGPFIESKEQIGGFTIVQVPDLDAALLWARKAARATTTPIEVRPFMEQSN